MDYSKETTFYFEQEDVVTGELFKGDFSVRRPTIGDQIQIQRDISRVKGDVNKLESGFETILFMLCYCKYVITNAPKWYYDSGNGENLYSAEIISELFVKIQSTWEKKDVPNEEKNNIEKSENAPVE